MATERSHVIAAMALKRAVLCIIFSSKLFIIGGFYQNETSHSFTSEGFARNERFRQPRIKRRERHHPRRWSVGNAPKPTDCIINNKSRLIYIKDGSSRCAFHQRRSHSRCHCQILQRGSCENAIT